MNFNFPDPAKLVKRYSNRLIEGIVNKAIDTQHEQALLLGAMLKFGIKSTYEVSRQLNNETNIDTEKLAQIVLIFIGGQFQTLSLLTIGMLFKDDTLRLIALASLPVEQTKKVNQILQEFNSIQFIPDTHEIFIYLDSLIASIQNERVITDLTRSISALWALALLFPIAEQAANSLSVYCTIVSR